MNVNVSRRGPLTFLSLVTLPHSHVVMSYLAALSLAQTVQSWQSEGGEAIELPIIK